MAANRILNGKLSRLGSHCAGRESLILLLLIFVGGGCQYFKPPPSESATKPSILPKWWDDTPGERYPDAAAFANGLNGVSGLVH